MNRTRSVQDIAIETAYSIARKLCREAFWLDEFCTWQGLDLHENHGQPELLMRTFGPELHKGVSGIALFLAELLVEVDDQVVEATLEGAVKTILYQVERHEPSSAFGLYQGKTGIGYALYKMGELREQVAWSESGLEYLEGLFDAEIPECENDVLSGVSGAIPLFLKLNEDLERTEFLELARRCGDFLIDQAQKEDHFWYWQTLSGEPPLCGYAHGAAGIALALLELYRVTGNENYQEAALMGFAFEKARFDSDKNDWPDLRTGTKALPAINGPSTNTSWSLGASGMALTRLRAYELTGNVDFLQEASMAMDITCSAVSAHLKNPAGTNYSLYHGLAGKADILMEGSRVLDEPVYAQVARQVAKLGRMLYDHTDSDWPSGIIDSTGNKEKNPTPGLLPGLAGTGYFYLRLSQKRLPDSVMMIR